MTYRLLFLDIDGTLVGASGILTPRTRAALQRAQEKSCTLVICTGRSRHAAKRVSDQIEAEGYSMVLNGALVFHWETGALLRQALMPLSVARQAVDSVHRHQMAPIWMGTEETDPFLYTDRRYPLVPQYQARNASLLKYCEDLAADMPAAPASIVAYGSPEKTTALTAAWRASLGQRVRAFAGPSGYGCWYAQSTTEAADKALAAEAVAKMLGIPREQTLAIGDHANDHDLLQWAGLGICMGDGAAATQRVADYITGRLDEEGAAQAIERFVL